MNIKVSDRLLRSPTGSLLRSFEPRVGFAYSLLFSQSIALRLFYDWVKE